MTSQETDSEPQKEMGFLAHLVELRDRLLKMVIAIIIVFAILFPFANTIYTFLSGPLTQHLPEGSSMIAIDVASPFLTPFKMVLMLAFVISIPYILHQAWSFIAPGLYKHEKKLAIPLLVSSVLLFYVGMAFAYYVVFPLVFGFFTSVAPEGVAVMTDINRYLDFVIMLFLAFGIAFEVPVATFLLVVAGFTTPQKLSKMRPYIVVGAFVIGMFLTPPDVISQILLAIPMWVLFELGLIFTRQFYNPKEEEADNTGTDMVAVDPMESVETALAEEPRYRPMTEEELDEELDRIEAEEKKAEDAENEKNKTDDDKKPPKPKT